MPEAEAVFQAHLPALRLASAGFLGAAGDEASDLVHDTYLVALPGLDRELPPAIMATWLRQICLRLCYARLRDRAGVLRCLDPELDAYRRRTAVERARSANLAVQKQQDLELLRELIKRLPPDERQMIQLRNVHGMSYAQIAATLDIPWRAVAARLLKSRERLRDLLAESPADGPRGHQPQAA